MQNGDGKGLKNALNLCNNVDTTDPKIVADAVSVAIDIFMGDVQYNGEGANNNVVSDCRFLNNSAYGKNPLDRLTKFIASKYGIFGDCINADYNADVTELQDSSWSSPAIDSRTWLWQTCTEFGYYQGLLQFFNF